jgi:hypothetical protein
MKQSSLLLCICLLLTCASAVADELSPIPGFTAPHSSSDQGAGSFGLLYRFAEEALDAKRIAITTEVWVDGAVAFSDNLVIDAPDIKVEPVVELFADTPEKVYDMRLLVESGIDVTFDIFVGEEIVETVSGAEIMARSNSLMESGALPQEIRIPFAQQSLSQSSAKTYCYQCTQQYSACVASNCDGHLPPRLCDRCDTIYDQCLATCDDCIPGTTSESTHTGQETTQTNDFNCYYMPNPIFSGDSATYRMLLIKHEVTETITTTHSDCSQTVTQNVTYHYHWCWALWDNSNCFDPDSNVGVPFC